MTDQKKQVDFDLIRAALDKQPKFKTAMRILAARTKGRYELSFLSLQRVLRENKIRDWVASDYDSFFSMLQKAGAGTVIQSNGQPRLRWDFSFRAIATKSLGMPIPKKKTGLFDKGELPPAVARKKHIVADLNDPVLSTMSVQTSSFPRAEAMQLLNELIRLIEPKNLTSQLTDKYTKLLTLIASG